MHVKLASNLKTIQHHVISCNRFIDDVFNCILNSLDRFLPLIICLLICVYRHVIVLPCPAGTLGVSPATRAYLSIVYSGPVDSLIVFLTLLLYYHELVTLSSSSQACYQVAPFPTQMVTSKNHK